MMANYGGKWTKRIWELFVLLFSLAYIVPAWMVVANSFKKRSEANLFGMDFPAKWEWDNYAKVFVEGKLLRSFYNGMLTAGVSVIVILVVSSMAAFVIARRYDRYAKGLFSFFLAGIILPQSMIATYLIIYFFGLSGSYLSLILVFSSGAVSASVFLYAGFIKTIPRDMDEAALIDGCGRARLFFQIVFPLLKPVTVTIATLNFIGIWNDVAVQLFLVSADKWTMPMMVYHFFGAYSKDWNLIFADLVLTVLPVLAVYVVGQRFIVSGMTAGAVKG